MVVVKGKRVRCKSATHSDTGIRNLVLGVRDSHMQKKAIGIRVKGESWELIDHLGGE